MKIKSLTLQLCAFFIVFFFCLLPPFFYSSPGSSVFCTWNFPVTQAGLFFFAVTLLYFEKDFIPLRYNPNKKDFIFIPVTFLLITCVSFVFQFLSKKAGFVTEIQVIKPEDSLEIIYCILNFLFASFYEEVIFRYFTPEVLYYLVNKKTSHKTAFIISETAATLLFAFSHFYLGPFSVLNAMFAHFILRFSLRKTDNILCSFVPHFLYNICQLFLFI